MRCIDAAKRGAKVRRIFLNYLDDDCWNPNPNGPFLKIGEWNPGEIAGDAARNHIVPMYDMSQISPAFKDRLQWVALHMKSVGLIPWIVFDDWCSEVEEDYRQFFDPTYGNCQLHKWWNATPPSAERQYGGGNQALELNPYREST